LSLAVLAIRNRHAKNQPLILPIFLVLLVVFQALLGMWTVTLKLYPIIVLAHLLGGLTTLAGLGYLTLTLRNMSYISLNNNRIHSSQTFKYLAFFALIALVLQIALGGWTSANYAALVCPGFPYCHNATLSIFPTGSDLQDAFQLLKPSLSLEARIAVHMMHRIGAVIITFILAWLIFFSYKTHMKKFSLCLGVLLSVQLLLGISNVIARLPLSIAVAHNAVAALLLLALVSLNFKLQARV
jgi:cytochrome c oxidase assembly protein subunit 15